MIRINPDNLVRVELTPEEQGEVLQYCQTMDSDLYSRIMNSPDGVLHLFVEDCNYLKGVIQREIEKPAKSEAQSTLSKILEKLSNSGFGNAGRNLESIEDLNKHFHGLMEKCNSTPDPETGGLSPDHVSRLIYSNWDDENCPIKFNKGLTIDDVKDSAFFYNARLFLNTLIQMEKENTATAKGNLTRKVVRAVFDKMKIPKSEKDFILKYNKVINEIDVRLLHHIRVVCESAGIIKLKKKFVVKKGDIELLEDKNAGELFYLLFFGYFRKFNIGYVDGLSELEFIQDTIPYSFYRLSKIGKKQVDIKKLKKQVFLPAALNKLNKEFEYSMDLLDEPTWLVESRIVKPLELFGLLECGYKKHFKSYRKRDKVKKNKLFDKFMRFEF